MCTWRHYKNEKKVSKTNHTLVKVLALKNCLNVLAFIRLNMIYLRGKKGFNGDLNCCDIHGFVTGFQATEVGTGGRGRCNPNGNLAWGLST